MAGIERYDVSMRPVFALTFLVLPAAAQILAPSRSAITYVEGDVFLDGKPVEPEAAHPAEMPPNAVLRSEHGRAEVLLNACAVLHMDANSSVRMLSNAVAFPRVELLEGTAVIQVDGGRGNAVGVQLRQAAFRLETNGFYRLESALPRISVYAGTAVAGGARKIDAGHALTLAGGLTRFDRNWKDDFEWWRESRIRTLAKESGLTAINRANHRSVLERDRICPAPANIGLFGK